MLIRRSPNMSRKIVTVGCLALCAATVALISGRSGEASADAGYASDVTGRTLPGAVASTTPGGPDGSELAVVLPAGSSPAVMTAAPYREMEIDWRAALAATVVSERDRSITSYSVVGESTSGGLGHRLRLTPDEPLLSGEMPLLEATSPSLARRQLDSNIATLKRAGAIDAATVTALDIDPEMPAVAHLVLVETSLSPSAIEANMGNYFQGLSNGLVGGDDNASDGLGVVVLEDQVPVAAMFVAARAGYTQTTTSPPVSMPDSLQVSIGFRNITGGPHPRVAGSHSEMRFPVTVGDGGR